MRELSLLKPVSAISIQVFLAYDDLQKIMDAIVKAFNAAEDKAAVMQAEVELPFQPFPIEQFSGEGLSTAGFVKLKGWLVTRRPSETKLPTF